MGTSTGTGSGESEWFARLMRELKERAGLSYGALARKLHTSTSTLHRYCNGEAVPTEFAVVDRFARVCGASQGEAVDLHRAWLLADARRRAGALGVGAVPVPVPVEGAEAAAEPGAASEAGGAVDGGAVAVVPPPAGDVARESARDADAGAPAPAPAAGGGGAGAELGLADVVDLVAPEPVVPLPWYRRRAAAGPPAGVAPGGVAGGGGAAARAGPARGAARAPTGAGGAAAPA
ncbi:helix-turn-helix domain-containing protein, partial [Streptomyces sp. NPDC058613]|uniref:helix-turn-helix domain-containing protein n=1 Tax=Streptomyces sp. NPDC058613 TaxID=3346556 RepID=UPI00364890F3